MAKRRTEAVVRIRRFTELLKSKIELEKIILVGSYTRGRQKRWSDIDLAVVSKPFEAMGFHERLVFM
ncbi:MAG: hypothetical protein GTO24_27590, partial [candidate division Zixibacteria bacterium]|nr:hypothetical protein [candidate division Zixibacteria bacterium]